METKTLPTVDIPTVDIFAAFTKWINQKPGLETGNYFSPYDRGERLKQGIAAYRSELRTIAGHRRRAMTALSQAQAYPFNAEAMADALQGSFSGRLTWTEDGFDYTTGQYWPTEYRIAAAVVLEAYCHSVRPKRIPQPSDTFTTIGAIKEAVRAAGSHWFDRDSMRFFNARVYPQVYPMGQFVLFISSERFDDNSPRKYTVRSFDTRTADIDTVGEFQGHDTKTDAMNAARIAVKNYQEVVA